jgi:two-component system sensor histidine kinase KdpD
MLTRPFSSGREWAYSAFIAIAGISMATPLLLVLKDHLGKGDAALLFLPVVALIAALDGVKSGLIAAPIAFMVGGYFLVPHYHAFYPFGSKDYVSLAVFLMIGLAMGWQTGRMRERESEALLRERETALLFRLSAFLSSSVSSSEMAEALTKEVAQATKSSGASLYTPDDSGALREIKPGGIETARSRAFDLRLAQSVYQGGRPLGLFSSLVAPESAKRSSPEAERTESPVESKANGLMGRADVYLPLRGKDRVEGVLYVGAPSEPSRSFSPQDERLLVSISYLVGAFLENQRLQSIAARAVALEEADRLKSTLVSSVSHELKTPLASVAATVTHLLENDIEWDPASFRRDLETAEKDLERLNGSIGSLLDLSRLESGSWSPKRDWHDLGEILGSARSKISRLQRSRLRIKIQENLPPLYADYRQWVRAILNLLENALEYSPPGSLVRVGAALVDSEIRIWVEDEGPGIAPDERERIFDKFFRGRSSAHVPGGTGLGLAIAREIIHFHGGKITVESASPKGARFVIHLPYKETPYAGPVEAPTHSGNG